MSDLEPKYKQDTLNPVFLVEQNKFFNIKAFHQFYSNTHSYRMPAERAKKFLRFFYETLAQSQGQTFLGSANQEYDYEGSLLIPITSEITGVLIPEKASVASAHVQIFFNRYAEIIGYSGSQYKEYPQQEMVKAFKIFPFARGQRSKDIYIASIFTDLTVRDWVVEYIRVSKDQLFNPSIESETPAPVFYRKFGFIAENASIDLIPLEEKITRGEKLSAEELQALATRDLTLHIASMIPPSTILEIKQANPKPILPLDSFMDTIPLDVDRTGSMLPISRHTVERLIERIKEL